MCNCREKRHWEKMNALIADREERANPQYNKMRLMGLGLHTIESPGTLITGNTGGRALWFPVNTGAAHSVLNQPQPSTKKESPSKGPQD